MINKILLITTLLAASFIEAYAERKTEYVNVFIGTGGHGHTFPGATLPHGMMQISPDTRLLGWDACSGYHYTDSRINGFSHTHLSGTGIGDYGDVTFMPAVGDKSLSVNHQGPQIGYGQQFTHQNEHACPGYYQVLLQDDQINVELTATLRAGMHRYTYPAGSDARLIIDLEPTIHGQSHPLTEIKIIDDRTVCGLKYTEGWAKKHYVYFYARFSHPFTVRMKQEEKDAAKAVLQFNGLTADGQVLAKVGISSVDEEGARQNLDTEMPDWDFDGYAAKADQAWERELSRIDIETPYADDCTIFYTSLYHTLVQPSISSDVDGRYRSMDMQIRQDTNYNNYTVFSLWDTFRALHPLYTIITPHENQAFLRSLLRKYEEQGVLPKWELASNETGTMIGYHAVSAIVDAIMKEQADFDLNHALQACLRSSVYDTTNITPMMNRSILHEKIMPIALKYKNEQGWIPCDKVGSSVAIGLEYAYNDWLIAQLAKKVGRKDIYQKYIKLSNNYRHYYDKSTHLMRPRTSDGKWLSPFDPTAIMRRNNYVEGNAWQWAWFVPQDVPALMKLMGGRKEFEKQLDHMFSMSSKLTGDTDAAADVTGMIGQYAHGNEPSHHIPYLYNFANRPDKTQALVDSILVSQYRNDPDGLCGNEDVGQMSAWYVLNALGFYSFCPGEPQYEIGRPLFNCAVIHLENGNDFTIRTLNNSRDHRLVKSVSLNGRKLTQPRFSHADLEAGGELVFEMK